MPSSDQAYTYLSHNKSVFRSVMNTSDLPYTRTHLILWNPEFVLIRNPDSPGPVIQPR